MTEPKPPREPPAAERRPRVVRHAMHCNFSKAERALEGDVGARDYLAAKATMTFWRPGLDFDAVYEWCKGVVDEQLEANADAIRAGEDVWEPPSPEPVG